MDERIKKLAKVLVNHSCRVQKGEKVYIHYVGYETKALARQLIKEVYEAGGIPFPHFTDAQVEREMLLHCTKEQLQLMAEIDGQEMSQMDCYIGIRGGDNVSEKSDVPAEKLNLYEQYYSTPVHGNIRVPKTKWVVLDIQMLLWHSFPIQVWKPLKTSTLMYVLWTTARWQRLWNLL